MWVVYDNPTDCPGHFVARRFEGGLFTMEAIYAKTLEEIRDRLDAKGLVSIGRMEGDQPHIVEVWI